MPNDAGGRSSKRQLRTRVGAAPARTMSTLTRYASVLVAVHAVESLAMAGAFKCPADPPVPTAVLSTQCLGACQTPLAPCLYHSASSDCPAGGAANMSECVNGDGGCAVECFYPFSGDQNQSWNFMFTTPKEYILDVQAMKERNASFRVAKKSVDAVHTVDALEFPASVSIMYVACKMSGDALPLTDKAFDDPVMYHGEMANVDIGVGVFKNATAAKEIWVENINLSTLEAFPPLPNLELLNLANIGIRTATTGLLALPALKRLCLVDCALEVLPKDVALMNKMIKLDLSSNKFPLPPPGSLPSSVENFAFWGVYHRRLPVDIANMSKLRELQIGWNDFQDSSSLSLLPTSLETLYLTDALLKDVPTHFKTLTNLKIMYLNDNSFDKIPDMVFSLTGLRELQIQRNLKMRSNPLVFSAAQIEFLKQLDVFMIDPQALDSTCSSPYSAHNYTLCIHQKSNHSTWKSSYKISFYVCAGLGALTMIIGIGFWRRRRTSRAQKKKALSVSSGAFTKGLELLINNDHNVIDSSCSTAYSTRSSDKSSSRSARSADAVSIWEDEDLLKWRMDVQQIQDQELVASGSYGEVWLARYMGKKIAVKRLRRSEAKQMDRAKIHRFIAEIKLHMRLEHPKIVTFLGVAWTMESDIQAMLEFMDNGDLRTSRSQSHNDLQNMNIILSANHIRASCRLRSSPPHEMQDNEQEQRLRAHIESAKQGIRQAEAQYNVADAVLNLKQLAAPLVDPESCHPGWKDLYLKHLYRDVSSFIVHFVVVHLEVCFSAEERRECLDCFFDPTVVPPTKSIEALAAILTATNPSRESEAKQEELRVSVKYCVHTLELLLNDDDALVKMFDEILKHEATPAVGNRLLPTYHLLFNYLASLPDVVHNRLELQAPLFFIASSYFSRLAKALFDSIWKNANQVAQGGPSDTFRYLTDKFVRVGQTKWLMQVWLAHVAFQCEETGIQSLLFRSLSQSSYEQVLLHLVKPPRGQERVCKDHCMVIKKIPASVCCHQQFTFVVTHKLLLTTAIHEPLIIKAVVDTLAHHGSISDKTNESPLLQVFDTVLRRWSSTNFSTSVDIQLNASICLFLRYALAVIDNHDVIHSRGWTMLLCKGVQEHMSHSVERVRELGMRVGESLSLIMSPDKPLDFGIESADPLQECMNALLIDDDEEDVVRVDNASNVMIHRTATKSTKKKGISPLDPDSLVDGDESDDDESENDSDAESEMSLEAYDLDDDEEDLMAPRPLYLKDLISALHAEDDRDKTEAALAEAETLLRKQPRDLQFLAKDVVAALLRLEDKYNTPNFAMLRSRALATTCALAPDNTTPYLITQALEKEQLLQLRLEVLQAMTTAAQELSGSGDFAGRQTKSLLLEDLNDETMKSLRTRRWGYRRDPLAAPRKNGFAEHAMQFFGPLFYGYLNYAKEIRGSNRVSDLDHLFLAHLLHALASFVESAGNSPTTVSMAKCLLELAWCERTNNSAGVRRQVLFCFSRVLLVVPPFLLSQELSHEVMQMIGWLQTVARQDSDDGCREASRLLLSSGINLPTITLPRQ
ncbi:TPA: hypothetical protein N0F65_000430 [Lagenidium giganteum]|uniref:Protein kinase domain-containing protein n=1 Tax=Lagenidium giganteum TaxID=4803 RepID=A0AAV2YK42_9STRA|nr:TPA: hypothetical protein N0F65_000430 [Lagenidium giganteum]